MHIKIFLKQPTRANDLNINAGSLAYYENVIYQFTIETTYLGLTYSQLVTIKVGQFDALPVINLGYYLLFI